MRILHRGLTAANVAIKRRPILAATVITSAKACCADLLIQTCVEGKDTIDKRRALLFGSFGFAYQGCFQYWLYNRVFESMFPGSGLKAAVCKTALSNIIADPCFFFPTFYSFREIVNKGFVDSACFTDGLSAYRRNYWTDWKNSWSIWIPGYAITYGLCPVHLRMPWIASVSFGYVALLSFTRGSKDKDSGNRKEETVS